MDTSKQNNPPDEQHKLRHIKTWQTQELVTQYIAGM